MADLIRDGKVREWSGSRYGTVITLSENAAESHGLELNRHQLPPGAELSDKLDVEFRDSHWVVRPFVADEVPALGAIGRAFDHADESRSNPYFHAKEDRHRHTYGSLDDHEGCRRQHEWIEHDRGLPSRIPCPRRVGDVGRELRESRGVVCHACRRHKPPRLERDLEPATQPETCDVCGHSPGNEREFDRLEVCLGCLRSGSDRLPKAEPLPNDESYEPQMSGGIGRIHLEKRYAKVR